MTHNLDPVQWDDDAAQELLIASREGVFVLNWDPDASALKLTQLSGTESGGAGEGRLRGHGGGQKKFFPAPAERGAKPGGFTAPGGGGRRGPGGGGGVGGFFFDGAG